MNYPDTIRIFETSTDEYGKETIENEAEVAAAVFEQNRGEVIVSVEPDDYIRDNLTDLEGKLVTDVFGTDPADVRYRVTDVNVFRDYLLSNEIDNVQLSLHKIVGIPEEDMQ